MPEKDKSSKADSKVHAQMLISYVPGEECRVAVVENGKLEEFHAERASSISRVGNIYVGTVTNVEPSIQAAFVDFGVEQHGFLHITDVHPRYFPGEDDETTERVGKKTPRRERPPIQKCFRRGDQVEVQVLKEGVGTKGPTLTSYLSIPGRFLVMMPQMDRVGVSRKVEDEEQRRAMRQILDQLDLPEGFGFILRTAGMDRNKTELKRDLAYLQRLWKDMEARRKAGSKPRLLYSESDLLVRALRDMLGPDISEIVIDNELALARAARFLKIVAPRSKIRLLQHTGPTPLFHAFGIEQQLALMHAREVPLPSGGRLVIDETEALVAIDVNSGRMRDARDAETNAYRTNCEAVEEICRQLKLRDLGGIIINDLIDMRHASHRKDIEQRFRERLKRDRARTTTLPISEFGILEMTRQRMRGSHESVHFVDCPTCRGRGMVQKPDSVAADALRNLAALLGHDPVARVEMVVSPRVASELLSGRRKSLNKIERTSGKHVDVRVSETVPVDRVTFYAYDAQGADIDIEALPKPKPPTDLKVWELTSKGDDESWAADMKDEEPPPEPELTPAEQAEVEEMPAHPIEFDVEEEPAGAAAENGQGGRKRRRRRRRGRGRAEDGQAQPAPAAAPAAPAPQPDVYDHEMVEPPAESAAPVHEPLGDGVAQPVQPAGESGEGGGRRRRRRRRRGRGRGGVGPDGQPLPAGAAPAASAQGAPIVFDEPPRGDSWDLPPSAIQPLPTPAAAPSTSNGPLPQEEPVAEQAPADLASDADDEGADLEPDDADQTEPAATDAGAGRDGETGGRRRKRRRRKGRGGGNGQGQPQGTSPPPAQQGQPPRPPRGPAPGGRPADGRPPQHAQPPRPPREPRIGGGYQKRAPAEAVPPAASTPTPLPPEPKPAPTSQPAAGTQPAPGAAPAPKPRRFLYSSRRRLGPGELPRVAGEE